ncbi:MAG: 16S rRNA (cytosine(967)-C(5))-methyltransferase RsmB [Dorea sp.]|jgi:16S rRNA (cytosine(967)-C(5))-methyltransferase|nr:16S rRNA (cytosine(967)-C(5))-methyltransferase RsmB [Dorea sp.]
MTQSINTRGLILDILLQITRDGEYSHIAVKNALDQYQYLEKQERAFITRVVNGTLERMIELDYIIDQFSKVKVNKMKPVIRTILRSAVYQLKYMDSVPASAACNEAVKLAVKRGFANLRGFVNGVLRNIGRNLTQIRYPSEDKLRCMSVKYSLPEWILKEWMDEYEEETVRAMAEEFLKEKPITVRFNPDRISKEELLKMLKEEGVCVKEDLKLPCALYLSNFDYLTKLKSFQKGYYQVQDISSMQVAWWASPREGDYIIDVCAAPGGKAIHLAELLRGTGFVEARDLTEYKIGLIQENIRRSGMTNIEAVQMDARLRDEASVEKADIVIADLPCSGLGVLGKKPDLKYKITKASQAQLVKLQRELLSVAAEYVKPEGTLIYSTCTIHREENERNAQWFAGRFSDFQLVREQQMLPGRDLGDGFYIAQFRRKASMN